jgi:hypothetical protein
MSNCWVPKRERKKKNMRTSTRKPISPCAGVFLGGCLQAKSRFAKVVATYCI